MCGETSDGRGREGGQKGDGLIASRRIWKWLKKTTQEREVPGEQQSALATPLRVGIKPGGERETLHTKIPVHNQTPAKPPLTIDDVWYRSVIL